MGTCCCVTQSVIGSMVNGRSPMDELEEELTRVGARKDVFLAFVLRWMTSTDIDSWMIEPNGTEIGFSTPYKGQLSGINSYNYVLDRQEIGVDYTSSLLTSNLGNLDKDCISCTVPSIENLVYFDRNRMQDGTYQYRLDDFSGEHTAGFEVHIIVRNEQYETTGYTKLVWDGKFSADKQRKANSTPMVNFTKQGNDIVFDKMNQHLRIESSVGLVWR